MSNENNEEIKKLQDDLADGKSMQSEEQMKQIQMTEEADGNAGTGTFNDYLQSFEPHQQRVVIEQHDLAQKTNALRQFIATNEIFKNLPAQEQQNMRAQLFHMEQYLGILNVRIAGFKGQPSQKSKGQDLIGDFGINQEAVFTLKYLAALYIDTTEALGNDPRRNSIVATDMEKVQMMAVKSVLS